MSGSPISTKLYNSDVFIGLHKGHQKQNNNDDNND